MRHWLTYSERLRLIDMAMRRAMPAMPEALGFAHHIADHLRDGTMCVGCGCLIDAVRAEFRILVARARPC